MKIRKTKVTAGKDCENCEDIKTEEDIILEEPVVDDIVEPEIAEDTVEEIDTEVEECNDAFCACKDHVQQAIECLGDLATNGDERAKEAIANLSIVYFDLQ